MKRMMFTLAAVVAAATLFGQEKNFIDQPYVEVTGQSYIEVVPDEIYLRIVITEKDNKGKISVDQQQASMFKQLKDIGIDLEKNLVVQDMASELQSHFLRRDGIVATKIFELKATSAAQLSAVFEAMKKAGISDVNVTRTDVSNLEELRQQVRSDAAKVARKNAEVLAQAVGQKVQWAMFIQDFGYSPRPMEYMNASFAAARKASADSEMPNLDFQKIRIDHSVMIRFALSPFKSSNQTKDKE